MRSSRFQLGSYEDHSDKASRVSLYLAAPYDAELARSQEPMIHIRNLWIFGS
jgi:hypothetical protein